MLAQVTLAQGKATEAREQLAESLRILQELGARWEMVITMVWLAEATRVIEGTPEAARRAVRVNAAAASLLASFGGRLAPVHQSQVGRTLAAAQLLLGEQATASAWAEGQAMSAQDAVAYALEIGD
jgi:hypothetical protein